jgi:uncharacterized protein HemX
MDLSLGRILDELVNGGHSAILSIVLLIAVILGNEVRLLRKERSSLLEQQVADKERHFKALDELKQSTIAKNEEMLTKYQDALSNSNKNSEKVKEMLSNLIMFLTLKK